ncbi:hypothetical protein LP419_01740 [Massilia sp. H-1]|nr:hypothetical protein LP419_01740 [Massilia sp. H-1]
MNTRCSSTSCTTNRNGKPSGARNRPCACSSRRQELRQDESIATAEQTLASAERLQAVRARSNCMAASSTPRTASRRWNGAPSEIVAELEHELAKKGAAREDESTQWAHLRRLAEIHMRTELEIAQQGASEARQMAQQRFSHQLLQQQIENKISQALGIEDEARKRAELVRLHQKQQDAARREREIEDEHHQARWQALALTNAAHKREAARVAEWEDQLALDRQRELLRADAVKDAVSKAEVEQITQKIEGMRRTGAQAESIAQYEKLLRTIEADGIHARQTQQIELDAEQRRHALRQQEQEAAWQQELRRMDHVREEKYAQHAHEIALARTEIARAESIGAMSDTAKVALAAWPECGRPGRCAENPGPR